MPFVLYFLFALFTSTVTASEEVLQPCKIYFTSLPPFSIPVNGRLKKGIYADLLPSLSTSVGLDCRTIEVPPERLFRMAKLGQLEILIAPTSSFDDKLYLIAEKPFFVIKTMIYWKDASAPVELSKLEGTVASILGFRYGGLMQKLKKNQALRFELVKTHEIGLNMVRNGRVDYFINYGLSGNEDTNKKNSLSSLSLFEVQHYFMVNRKIGRARQVFTGVVEKFEELRSAGEVDLIIEKWIDHATLPENATK